jgi:hypothetical protein
LSAGGEPCLEEKNIVWGGEPCLWEENLVWGVEPFSLNIQIIWLSNILALSGVVCTKFDIYDFIM